MHDVIKAFGVQTDFSIQELPQGETLESGCEETLLECKYCPGLSDCKFAQDYATDAALRILKKSMQRTQERENICKLGLPADLAEGIDEILALAAKKEADNSIAELLNQFIPTAAESCLEDTKDSLGLNAMSVPKQTVVSKILKTAKETLAGLAAATLITYSTFFPQHLEPAGYKLGRDLYVDVYVQKDVPYPIRLIQS